MRHTISVLVENRFGVLARVASLFSGRGYNIDSLCVAETLDPTASRITLVTHGSDNVIEQIMKQLNRLIDVVKVTDLTGTPHVERELVLVKVHAEGERRNEVMRIVDVFRGKVVDVTTRSLTIELTGDEEKIEAFLALLRPLGIRDVARSGRVAMAREPIKKPVAEGERPPEAAGPPEDESVLPA